VVSGSPVRFVVIGDATLDVTVLNATPIPGADRPVTIEIGPGGQGANVAVRLARGGHPVRLVTAIGPDPIGAELRTGLAAEGVEVLDLGAPRTGIVVALLDAAGERAMLSDRASLGEASWSGAEAALADTGWIHLSGYPLADDQSGRTLAEALGARRPEQRASVGGGSFMDGAAVVGRLRVARPDLLLFDRREAVVLTGALADAPTDPARSAADLAGALAEALGAAAVVTDGPAGAAAAIGGKAGTVEAAPRPVVDATGAGDAHAAAVLGALARGPWPPRLADLRHALEIGGPAGAEVAAVIGAQARTTPDAPT
jgi:sugar/nucleoside kinase (ribokinase family)